MEYLVLAFIVLLVAGMVWNHLAAGKRREAWFQAATQLGLNYSRDDPFQTVRLPFGLFRRGEGRGIDNMVWGPWQGMDARVFDYWFYTESTNSKGQRSRHYRRFTCALTPAPATWPHLSITRETIITRLGDFAGFRDIQFESDEFNRCFQVKSTDPRFASYLVDPRMMQWLMDAGSAWSWEVHAGWLLVWTGRIKDADLRPHLDALEGFTQTVPAVVHDVYGSQ